MALRWSFLLIAKTWGATPVKASYWKENILSISPRRFQTYYGDKWDFGGGRLSGIGCLSGYLSPTCLVSVWTYPMAIYFRPCKHPGCHTFRWGGFCRDLDKLIPAALPSDNLMVMGDLSARVGRSAKMWKTMIQPQRISLFLHGKQAKQNL